MILPTKSPTSLAQPTATATNHQQPTKNHQQPTTKPRAINKQTKNQQTINQLQWINSCLLMNQPAEPPAFLTALGGAPNVGPPRLLRRSPAFEELRHHAAHRAAADALQRGHVGGDHLIHTRLQDAAPRKLAWPGGAM